MGNRSSGGRTSFVSWKESIAERRCVVGGTSRCLRKAFGDLLLVGGADEIQYRHIGDAYVLPEARHLESAQCVMKKSLSLAEANPELWKLLVALRRVRHEYSYDYLMVADDDNFISLANAIELLDMLPPRKVYVGNMIDTVPQRFHQERRVIIQETKLGRFGKFGTGVEVLVSRWVLISSVGQHGMSETCHADQSQICQSARSVNLYLGSPSKLPIFAHGLGFIISVDLAELLADLGLSFKLRGNDDMLIGMWLRNIADVRFLHYHPWFHDHHEFGGLFSRPCQYDAVIVHRMTPERWRTFDKYQCHICSDVKPLGEALSLDTVEPSEHGEVEELPESSVEELASLERARQEQKNEETNSPLKLAILVFGSRWHDFKLRAYMRRAMGQVKHDLETKHSDPQASWASLSADFEWLFVMTQLPGDWRRHLALREILLRRDLVALGPARLPRESQSAENAGKVRPVHEVGCYRYEEAWRLVEERWGGADFLLLLDHRSYANVPRLLTQMPGWPRRRPESEFVDELCQTFVCSRSREVHPYIKPLLVPSVVTCL